MAKRRMGTIPQRVRLTQQTSDRIDEYQAKHQIPSFSAAIEQLVCLGLEQSPGEIIAPIIVSTMRQELNRHFERVIKLLVLDIVETGMARRLAGAAVRDVGRLKQDEPERYDKIKEAAWKEARQMLARSTIEQVLRELEGAPWAKPDDPPPTD